MQFIWHWIPNLVNIIYTPWATSELAWVASAPPVTSTLWRDGNDICKPFLYCAQTGLAIIQDNMKSRNAYRVDSNRNKDGLHSDDGVSLTGKSWTF